MPRPRDILGGLRTVLFAPEDLAIVRGDPSERRRFLDEVLVQRAPRLAGVRADYDRVLKQRAALLKTAGPAGAPAARVTCARSTSGTGTWPSTAAQLLAARLELVRGAAPATPRQAYARAGAGQRPARPYVMSARSPMRWVMTPV